MHTELHLHEGQAPVPTAYTNEVDVDVLACCSHEWGCTRSPAISTAQFRMAHGPVVGYGLENPFLDGK